MRFARRRTPMAPFVLGLAISLVPVFAAPAGAAVAATASVDVHVQYRDDAVGTLFTFTVANTSTAGESIAAVEIFRPSPEWDVQQCPTAPAGWATQTAVDGCVYQSAFGAADDIAPGSVSSAFTLRASTQAGDRDASGAWSVLVSPDPDLDDDVVPASPGAGGLGTTIHVFEALDAVVATSAPAAGALCPSPWKTAPAGSSRVIVVCGRNRGSSAQTPQAASSSLGGSFVQAAGTFSSGQIEGGTRPSVVLAAYAGTSITANQRSGHVVIARVGSAPDATSPVTTFRDYSAIAPPGAPALSATAPSSPANDNAPEIRGTAPAGTRVTLYSNSSCSSFPLGSGSVKQLESPGITVSVPDDTTRTFYARATDSSGGESGCSSGITYREDSTPPVFAGAESASAVSDTQVRLRWQAASDAATPSTQLVYDVCVHTSSGGCGAFSVSHTTPPGATSFTVTGLSPRTRYHFVVRARDKAGNRDANAVERASRTMGASGTVSVAAGGSHTCSLQATGHVHCWGANGRGQLGNGTTNASAAPVLALLGATGIAAGINHTCAVMVDGRLRCWGSNTYGQLGDGTTDFRSSPTEVPGLTDIVKVTAKGWHTCALRAEGTVYCWGNNEFGQLGDGTTTDRATPAPVLSLIARDVSAGTRHTCAIAVWRVYCWGADNIGNDPDDWERRTSPEFVVYSLWATSIEAGGYHTCATFVFGSVKCWGNNSYGQLGDGTTDDRREATWVSSTWKAIEVVTGAAYTCARLSDGTARCWGANGFAQLGLGSSGESRSTPAAVPGLEGVRELSAGQSHSCAVVDDGSLRCWGSNHANNLGSGPAEVPAPAPISVIGVAAGVAVVAGDRHTCALMSDGTVRCWGRNDEGQLGDGTTTDRTSPVEVGGLGGAVAIAAGPAHTCAVISDGTARCWGRNDFGQLGDGTTTDRSSPVNVSGLADFLGNAVSIAAGTRHTCARLSSRRVKCWGDNQFGQLGNGTTTSSTVPVTTEDVWAADITAGSIHTCAIDSIGQVFCWGHNGDGQLGDGTTTDRSVPDLVSGLTTATSVSAGAVHTCARLIGGQLTCWGSGSFGRLGNAGTGRRTSPDAVAWFGPSTRVWSGGSHSCAHRPAGPSRCWGYNGSGQLGDGTTTWRSTGVPVSGLGSVRSFATGTSHTCALKVDGGVRCWGYNGAGQLGNGSKMDSTTGVQVIDFP